MEKEDEEVLTRIKFDDFYNDAIIGTSFDYQRLVYSFEKMLMLHYENGDTDPDKVVTLIDKLAQECTEYNSPIIIQDLGDDDKEQLNID